MKLRSEAILLVLFSVFVTILLNSGCQNAIAGQETGAARSIIFAGLERTYRIYIPPSNDKAKPLPLLIALHGGGGTGKAMEKLTLEGLINFQTRRFHFVVYPMGLRSTGMTEGKMKYRAHQEKIDDVGFISALIDHLAKQYNIDIRRVYATGISNGALMSFRLGCELSEKITAIAPVAGSMPENLPARCSPSRPIPVIMISNTDDRLVPWEGGDIRFGRKTFGRALSIPETVKYWVNHNQCSASPSFRRNGQRSERWNQGEEGIIQSMSKVQ
jgi:polyhydroxybutyrate depolymerase